MLLTLVAATPFEIAPLRSYLEKEYEVVSPDIFKKDKKQVRLLVTGVGMTLTALQLGAYLAMEKPNMLINVGISGAFDRNLALGSVVNVISERFGDLGAEDAEGNFMDIHEMDLIGKNAAPFQDGVLFNPQAANFDFLPTVNGLTVNKVHGTTASIEKIQAKYEVQVESMEGAAFFLAAQSNQVPFLQIRGISNYVEARNKENWDIPLAINQLNKTLIEIVKVLA